jgi:alkylhydroperoxidase family enzyme
MARISLEPRRGMGVRLGEMYARLRFGRVADPVRAIGHSPGVMVGLGLLEMAAARWHRVDPKLTHLALMASAARIGCSWCVDFGYWEAEHLGLPAEKIRAVSHWRGSDAFSELERLVLDYAEAMTETPPTVTDELVARLQRHLDDAQLVELTTTISLENLRSRTNTALGLKSEGFSDACAVKPALR